MNACFIALEGVDGAGKSTQVERLARRLEGDGCVVTTVREPGGTEVGERVRQILLSESIALGAEAEALLFLTSRVELYRQVIAPALARGEVVISDRYHLSTLVYQGVAGELGLERTRELLTAILGSRRPDLNVVVRVPVERCRERLRGEHGDRFENRPDFLPRVARAYEDPPALPGDRIIVIDGDGTPDNVAERLYQEVCRAF